MGFFDIINISVTIALGILSLGLSIFSIAISIYFSKGSNKALKSIEDLAHEIKLNACITLNNQQKYTDKMLDSILYKDNYDTRNKSIIDETVVTITNEVSDHFNNMINKYIQIHSQELSPELKNLFNEMQNAAIDDIKQKLELPPEVKLFLERKKKSPANYIFLRALIKSNAKNKREIHENQEKYNIISGWDKVFKDFFDCGILKGNEDNFEITKEIEKPIRFWLDLNEDTLIRIIEADKKDDIMARNISNNDIIIN